MAAVMLAGVCLSMSACDKSSDVYTVGICQLVTHDALDSATEGFKDALIAKLGEDKVKFDYQNAQGDSAMCSTIVNKFVSDKVDLIMANATASLQAAYNATEKIPILGTSVTEYGVALSLKSFNGTVGGNVSGTSDLAPLEKQADAMLELVPTAKKVGLLYCSAEPNSDYQVKVVEEYLNGKGISTKRYSFSDSNDVATVAKAAAEASDAIYVPTDNTVASCGEIVGSVVRAAKVPLFAGEEGICKSCGIATLSISYYDLGYKTGEMAAEILLGNKNIEDMPIEYVDAVKKYNPDMCKELGITVSSDYTAIG